MTTPKVSVYSLSDLKNTLDDHLPLFLTSPNLLPTSSPALPSAQRFTSSHTHTYVRLGLGYSAVSIAVYLFYLDYYLKVPFSEHKTFAAPAVVVYFVLNAALTAWVWLGEKGIIFAGSRREKSKAGVTQLKVYSRAPQRKYDPTYRLTAEWTTGVGAKSHSVEVLAPFTRFFAADGSFVPSAFEGWLRDSIPVLGDRSAAGEGKVASSQNAASSENKTISDPTPQHSLLSPPKPIEQDEEDGDVVVVGSPVSHGAQASSRDTPSASGGKKRSKRKA